VKERLVTCNEEDTDGRARVTRDEERVLPTHVSPCMYVQLNVKIVTVCVSVITNEDCFSSNQHQQNTVADRGVETAGGKGALAPQCCNRGAERQCARMSKITNKGLTRSGAG